MRTSFSQFLRELRQLRGWSQVDLAKQAGIGRVTLNRWESGKQRPRLAEMEAVLHSLQATSEQIQQAIHLLDTVEARMHKHPHEKRADDQKNIGLRPDGGSLLLALRLRSGLSQEEVALRIGVTTRTVRRWEKAEVWPSTTQLHTLCYALGALPRELLALTTGGSKLAMESHGQGQEPTLEELENRLEVLHRYTNDPQLETLKDLGFIVLEAQAWPWALRSASGRQLLAYIYSCHANRCSVYERWGEGAIYANRSLDLLSFDERTLKSAIQSTIATARCATYGGQNAAPTRGLEILRPWLDATSDPSFQSWVLSDMAKYSLLSGDLSGSLQLARRASEILVGTRFSYDLYLRELDEAQILLEAGDAAQTLEILERDHEIDMLQEEHTIQFLLLEAEASLQLQSLSRASECLQRAQQLICAGGQTQFHSRAQKIIEQI